MTKGATPFFFAQQIFKYSKSLCFGQEKQDGRKKRARHTQVQPASGCEKASTFWVVKTETSTPGKPGEGHTISTRQRRATKRGKLERRSGCQTEKLLKCAQAHGAHPPRVLQKFERSRSTQETDFEKSRTTRGERRRAGATAAATERCRGGTGPRADRARPSPPHTRVARLLALLATRLPPLVRRERAILSK